MSQCDLDVERFRRGRLVPETFTHREHVRMAFLMIQRYEFLEAALHYSRALRRLCMRAGHADKFNQTLTLAFLSLIAERIAADPKVDFATFATRNPDLMSAGALAHRYSAQRLASETAHRIFLLPDLR